MAFGQTQHLGMNLLPPRVLFTDPLGPAWVLSLLKCTDKAINKLTADSRGANIPPTVSSFLTALG